jgi:hypothetical protein
MNILEFLMDIFLHIALIAVIIPVIFFTYGTYLQKKVIRFEISKILYDALRPYIPVVVKHMSTVQVENTAGKISDSQDKRNKEYEMKAALYLGIMSIVSIIIFFILCYFNGRIPIELLGENIVLVLSVVATELIFFTYIAANYRPIDIDEIKNEMSKPYSGC